MSTRPSMWQALKAACGLLLLILMSCSQEQEVIRARLDTIPSSPAGPLPAATAFDLPEEAYFCALVPYAETVGKHFDRADQVNEFLRLKKFRGDEGRWAIVFQGKEGWTLETISRRYFDVELVNRAPDHEDGSLCASIKNIRIIKSSPRKILTFIHK